LKTNSKPYQFTVQRKEAVIGLYDYHARFFDPSLGRFVQADTIVPGPGSPQSWDRNGYDNSISFFSID
jgi:RHS repeat-associated protein